MSRASSPEKENQSNTTTLKAKDIVKGKIPLVNLPEPYLFVYSDDGIQNGDLAKAVNILAIKMQYRVVDFSVSGGSVFSGQFVVCMIKEEESEEEANSK
jgi:hypothetical protein